MFLSLSGGRFKKEVLVEGHNHLLLIREEAGPPDAQVCVYTCVCVCLESVRGNITICHGWPLPSHLREQIY